MTKPMGIMEKRRHALFMRRTYTIYRHLEERASSFLGAKPMPFDLKALRDAVQAKLGTPCPYLPEVILTAKNFSLDHAMPVSRGGDVAAWSNLVICSSTANLAKGELTRDEFTDLVLTMEDGHWPRVAVQNVLGRLKAGGSITRLRFLSRFTLQAWPGCSRGQTASTPKK